MASNPYPYDYGGTTLEDVERRRAFAQALMQSGMDSSPVAHPLSAVARAFQGAMGGYMLGRARMDERRSRQVRRSHSQTLKPKQPTTMLFTLHQIRP